MGVKMLECDTIGKQLNEMCKHGLEFIKPIQNMQICPNAKQYCMELVECGELDVIGCEPCTIEWLCGDAIDSCMNPEDSPQWWLQCVQPHEMWMECIEAALNNAELVEHMLDYPEYASTIKSMLDYVQKHGIVVKLVKMD